jgi:hypothetical protein
MKLDLSTYKLPTVVQKKSGARSERDELLDKFLDKLNSARVSGGFAPLSHPRVAKLLKGMDTQAMYALYRECDQAKSFGGLFWFKVKGRKH